MDYKPGDLFKPRLHSRAFVPDDHYGEAYVVEEEGPMLYLGSEEGSWYNGETSYKFLLPNMKIIHLSRDDVMVMLEPFSGPKKWGI